VHYATSTARENTLREREREREKKEMNEWRCARVAREEIKEEGNKNKNRKNEIYIFLKNYDSQFILIVLLLNNKNKR
jgi:hypothetical protein